jgi:hypothetical protein
MLALFGTASAHDLYLTLESVKGVCAGIGEHFPYSENAITADRLALFRVRDNRGATRLAGKIVSRQFCARVSNTDQFLAETVVQPKFIKLAAKDFNSYIHGEGLTQIEKQRADDGKHADDGRELYSRYSKPLVGKLSRDASQLLGHTLEIIPQRDPAELKAGETLQVQVLFKGKPLRNAQVSAVYENAKPAGHEYPVTTRTDESGVAELKLDRGGLWYARLIYMEPAQNDPEIDWRSYFSTLTFSIGNRSQSSAANGQHVPEPLLWDLNKVESALKTVTPKVRRDVAVNQPFLSVPGRVFVIGSGEAEVQTYIYGSSEPRARDTDKLDPNQVTPPTMRARWMMPPILVTSRNLAAIILTRNETLRQKIAAALNK